MRIVQILKSPIRKPRTCRMLVPFLRGWGPLALREILENWQSAMAPDERLAGGDFSAERRRSKNREITATVHAAERS
jgi:hypothetical protein